MIIPEARPDGLCADCQKEIAVTRDGRFCRKCLKARVFELSPNSRNLTWRGTDQIGRSSRSSKVLGGTVDNDDENDDN